MTSAHELTPPHNIEAEQALLGALLCDNHAFGMVEDIIRANDFYDPLHGRIFFAIARNISAGRVADPITLKSDFLHEPMIGEWTAVAYLGLLVSHVTSVLNAPDYARTVVELSDRRKMMNLGENLVALGERLITGGHHMPLDSSAVEIIADIRSWLGQILPSDRMQITKRPPADEAGGL